MAGLAGLFLPFLQGILFLAVGVMLLARESYLVKRILVRLRQRFPQTAEKFAAIGDRAQAFIARRRNRP